MFVPLKFVRRSILNYIGFERFLAGQKVGQLFVYMSLFALLVEEMVLL